MAPRKKSTPAQDPNPFLAPPPEEVPLPKAPLVRVIAQIRFSPDLGLGDPRRIAPFQDQVRDSYPELQLEEGPFFPPVLPSPNPSLPTRITYRFTDPDNRWRASLSHDFLALETNAYTSRSDFLGRFQTLLKALEGVTKTESVSRIGIRYIDRIREKDFSRIQEILAPSMITGVEALFQEMAQHFLHDMMVTLPGTKKARLRARWGFLPPNKTVDPNALESLPEKTWILDTDAFSTARTPLNPERISKTTAYLAEKAYAFFRFAVTDRFLELYGGKP